MELRVQYEDKRIESITLVPPVEVLLGKSMNHFACGDGTDFYFTSEGYYDGWGRSTVGKSDKEVDETINRMKADQRLEEE